MNFKLIRKGVMVTLATLILASPMSALAKTTTTPTYVTRTSHRTPQILINGKVSNNRNKLQLDTNENYITLKGKYKNCNLKTNSKKVKLRYWGTSGKKTKNGK